jgi:SAM-dependent methyltransferase
LTPIARFVSKPPQSSPVGANSPTDFDAYRDSYLDAVQAALPLPGTEAAYFSKLKADHLVELARRCLGPPEDLSVLDVGCGVGATDAHLDGRFGVLAGVDVAAELVESAAEANPGVSYRSYSKGAPLPHDAESFDLSFAICVLHHVPPPEWRSFIGEMARVTRPGGLVCVMEHNPWNPLTRKVVRDCEFDRDAVLLSRRELIHLMAEQGLSKVSAPYIAFFPRELPMRRSTERLLAPVPLGAQYYVAARRPDAEQVPA